ncbi:MAG: toxic anion resistance protein [Gammaproteobacteria bacterium]|nr:toxic anion resistance protein [Gammaproteobacteria bacterium]
MADTIVADTTLTLPVVETVRKELSLTTPTEVAVDADDAELGAQADAIVDELVSLDTTDLERRREVRNAVESMAVDVQQDVARRSAMLKEPLAKLSSRAEDGGAVATSLVDLRQQVEELDPAGMDFSISWFGRLLGMIPGVGTPLRRYFARYESSSRVIDDITASLVKGREQLKRDNITLGDDQKQMREAGLRLEQAVKLGQMIDRKLEARLTRELANDPERSKFVQEELIFPLRQRIQDLQQQLLVSQQGVLTSELITRNNKELIRGVDRSINVTVNALQTAVTLALALNHQKIVLDKVEAVTATTNTLIAGTAERLKQQGAEIQKRASSTALDMDVLKGAFADIKEALDDISRYRQEALPQMAQNIIEMDQMAAEAESAIVHAEEAKRQAGQLSITLDGTST